ncbi:hypothetical protein A3I18_02405 [Candidatus Campbellbacteria bacterium RIFCSPLOWO2_02_FULL_35_11]|uniref:GIY-YIG domain-containing protein n=2 Tax=Candidatus Campbelliibacteriota TaxID=1752727 RepID=A0A1F5EQ47_9BACT|nr:MAG: hypothetical protein A3E89_00305 [Candidatus Campbellbacteria bacterium RIFCSPHIGHO2_12_FULL_35_10]OGD69720.1 MAG: hypothetical protein A3I18_02405 [Candidatus Campbellbacteria bacterium RIFCSPLOWO2_02_FULL_35_11]
MKEKTAYVYIMSSKKNGTIYTGVTSNLEKRVYEHKNNVVKGFTQKYNVHILVYYEFGENILSAIEREKQIKGGSRKNKIKLIEKDNPEWRDLSDDLFR